MTSEHNDFSRPELSRNLAGFGAGPSVRAVLGIEAPSPGCSCTSTRTFWSGIGSGRGARGECEWAGCYSRSPAASRASARVAYSRQRAIFPSRIVSTTPLGPVSNYRADLTQLRAARRAGRVAAEGNHTRTLSADCCFPCDGAIGGRQPLTAASREKRQRLAVPSVAYRRAAAAVSQRAGWTR